MKDHEWTQMKDIGVYSEKVLRYKKVEMLLRALSALLGSFCFHYLWTFVIFYLRKFVGGNE